MEIGAYLSTVRSGSYKGMSLQGWTGDNGDPDNFLHTLLGCAAAGPGGIPLTNNLRFLARSPGYLLRRMERFAGQPVLIRFRLVSDFCCNATGWAIDDIAVSGITNTPFPTLVSEPSTCRRGLGWATFPLASPCLPRSAHHPARALTTR